MRAKRRTFTAYFVEPFKQIRFGLYVVSVCLSFVVLLGWLYARAFQEQYQHVIDIFQVIETSEMVQNDIFIKNAIIIGLALAGLVCTMIFVVVRRTHKMYGPMVSIHRFVQELQKGNYAVRIAVRENDDFQSLVNELNNLAEALHERHPETIAGLDSSMAASGIDSLEDGVVIVNSPKAKASSQTVPPQAS